MTLTIIALVASGLSLIIAIIVAVLVFANSGDKIKRGGWQA